MRILQTLLLATALPSFAAAQSYDGFSVGGQLSYGDAETSGAADLDGEDFLFGLRAYYDFDTGAGFLIGGGLQYDTTDIDLDWLASVDDVFRVAIRGGAEAGGIYYYGTVGYVQASTSGDADAGDGEGYFVGAGLETFVADQVTVGGEILYHEIDGFDNIDTLDAEVLTIGANVNYRF